MTIPEIKSENRRTCVDQEAQAARSGGRIGGTASAARSKPPPRAPVASSSSKTDGSFESGQTKR